MDDLTRGSQNNLSKDVDHDNNIENINLTFLGTRTQDPKFLNVADASYLKDQIIRAYKKNELVQTIMTMKVNGL